MEVIQLGKIGSTHGLDGRLVLLHHLGDNKALKSLNCVFVELRRESYIPFFIKSQKSVAEGEVLLQFDEVETVEEAKKLAGKQVYLEVGQYEKVRPKNAPINFVGFQVIDQDFGALGKVADLLETPGQLLASVFHNHKEVLIPLNDHTIAKVDVATKTISVRLPEGLLDVYLSEE